MTIDVLIIGTLCPDSLLLRPQDPGELIHGGDLDNRLKTLFDALTIPDENQLAAAPPAVAANPFFCLLQDDALITQVRLDTDRLLRPGAGRITTRLSGDQRNAKGDEAVVREY